MAKSLPEFENPMLRDPIPYRSPEPVYKVYKPDPVCKCGCNQVIEVVQFRTFENEPVASEECFMRIAYKEKWIERVAV